MNQLGSKKEMTTKSYQGKSRAIRRHFSNTDKIYKKKRKKIWGPASLSLRMKPFPTQKCKHEETEREENVCEKWGLNQK